MAKNNHLLAWNNQPQVQNNHSGHEGEDVPLSIQVQRQCQCQMTLRLLHPILVHGSPTPDAYAVHVWHQHPRPPLLPRSASTGCEEPPHSVSIFFPQTNVVLPVPQWGEMSLQECAAPRSLNHVSPIEETQGKQSLWHPTVPSSWWEEGIKIREHSSSRSRTKTPQGTHPVTVMPCVYRGLDTSSHLPHPQRSPWRKGHPCRDQGVCWEGTQELMVKINKIWRRDCAVCVCVPASSLVCWGEREGRAGQVWQRGGRRVLWGQGPDLQGHS